MGMFLGLQSEEYDKIYKDRVLLKRILKYFKPYKKLMIIVITILTISSITNAFIPILVSVIITNLATNRNIT